MTKIDENLYKYGLKGFTDAKVMFNDWFYGGNKSEELDLSATGKMRYDSSAADKWAKTDDINVYFYKTGASGPSWPGVPMEKVDGKEGLYTYTLPKEFEGAMVLFNTKNGSVQVPKDTGFKVPADTTMIYDNGWKEYVQGTSKVYFRKPSEWGEPYLYAYKTPSGENAKWPGIKMEKVFGTETLYSYTLPENFGNANVIINDKTAGSDDGNQTKELILPFETSKIYDEKTEILRDFTIDDLKEPEKEVEPGEVRGVTKIYFKNTSGWTNVNAYAYNDGTADKVKEWPGVKVTDEGEGLFSYTLPKGFEGATVIFKFVPSCEGPDNNREGEWRAFEAKDVPSSTENTDPEEPTDPGEDKDIGSTVYVKVPEGWSGVPNIHYWNTAGAATKWPGKPMKDEGNGVFSYGIPESFGDVSIIINDGKNRIIANDGKDEFAVNLGSSIIFEDGEWKDYVKPTPDPDKETSKTPTVSGTIYTSTTTVNGTAGANADIILTVDEEIKTTTSVGAKVEVISTTNEKEIGSTKADEKGKWSAEISKQSKGTVITVTATEDDKVSASAQVTVRKKSSSSHSSGSSSSSNSNTTNNTTNNSSNSTVATNNETSWKQLPNGQWNYINYYFLRGKRPRGNFPWGTFA